MHHGHAGKVTLSLLAATLSAGLVGCEDVGAPLAPGDGPEAAVVESAEGIDPTSLRSHGESWPTTPPAAVRLRASVVATTPPATIVIFGDFPPAMSELESVLTAIGHSVTNVSSLPADLSGFDVVWHIGGFFPLTDAEQTRLADFLAAGGGVHLSGERSCCELLNGSLETFVNTVVTGGGITGGGLGDFEPIGPFFTFNPDAVGDVTTYPNVLGTWSPAVAGGMAGLDPENVLVSHDATDTPNGGVWRCGELADGQGRLTLLMDVNWLDPSVNAPSARDPEIANLQTFLQDSCDSAIEVDVDLKPGSDENTVPLRSRGRLPVAILTTPDFDAAEVDPATVTLGDGDGPDTPVATRPDGRLFSGLEDVDGDADLDLLLRFDIQSLVAEGDLDVTTGELVLRGETLDGTAIEGSTAVTTVGGGRPGRR